MNLFEGMRNGDLEDLVLPLLSVDEYESKVDDNAVVFGFYVHDHDAAHDLNRFIQKSPVLLLDTDVSPAPDQRGYYIVFVELLNNDRLGEEMEALLDEVSSLSSVESWKMRLRGVDRLVPFSEQALNAHFDQEEKTDEVSESVMKFLQPSAVERILAEPSRLVLEGYGYREEYEIVAFGRAEEILAGNNAVITASDVDIKAATEAARMDRRLGEGWIVSRRNGMSLISRPDSDQALLLRK
jgi:hypothetical protein